MTAYRQAWRSQASGIAPFFNTKPIVIHSSSLQLFPFGSTASFQDGVAVSPRHPLLPILLRLHFHSTPPKKRRHRNYRLYLPERRVTNTSHLSFKAPRLILGADDCTPSPRTSGAIAIKAVCRRVCPLHYPQTARSNFIGCQIPVLPIPHHHQIRQRKVALH